MPEKREIGLIRTRNPLLGAEYFQARLSERFDAYNEAVYRAFWESLRRGEFQAGEFHRVGRDGREVWIQASYNPVLDAAGRPCKVVKFATDVTMEVQRRQSFAILSLVANETDNSVIITDAQDRIEYVNPGFTRLTGYTAEEVIGRKPGALLQGRHTDENTVRRIGEHLRRCEPFHEEILNYTSTGQPYWISLSINPVLGKDGTLERYVSVQANVTATKQLAVETGARLEAIERSNVVIEWTRRGGSSGSTSSPCSCWGCPPRRHQQGRSCRTARCSRMPTGSR